MDPTTAAIMGALLKGEKAADAVSGGKLLVNSLKKFFTTFKHKTEKKADRPCKYYLIMGSATMDKVIWSNKKNKRTISDAIDILNEGRMQHSDNKDHCSVLDYLLARGYILLDEKKCAKECLRKINGDLTQYPNFLSLKEELIAKLK